MRSEKKAEELEHIKVRKYWHAYHLQNLSPKRFIRAVGDILKNEKYLIPPDRTIRNRA